MHRPKIYFLLSNCPYLEPISGDRINEMNVIRALSENYDVYYNNVLVDPTLSVFGDKASVIAPPNQNYDLHYIRANRNIFLQCPDPKIWMAVPYDYHCFKAAAAVSTFTPPWTTYLRSYNSNTLSKSFFQDMYPDQIPEVNAITINQVVDPQFKSLQEHEKTKYYREKFNSGFIIGHFGRIVKSCYPHTFLQALPALKEKYPQIRFVCCGSLREEIPAGLVDYNLHIPYEDMPYAVSACNLIIYNQDLQGNFAGSLKVLEAVACGIPVLLPRYLAREAELGKDYPYFWPPALVNGQVSSKGAYKIYKFISELIDRPNATEELKPRLLNISKKYSIAHSAQVFKAELDKIINNQSSQ